MRLQVVLQADHLDQALLLLQPVGVIFFSVSQLRAQDVAADVVLVQLAQLDAFAQRGTHLVFELEVSLDHFRHGAAHFEVIGTHVGGTFEHEDAAHQRVGVLRLFFHLVVDALVELGQAPVFIHTRVNEVLVACCQFALQQRDEVVDYVRVTLHRPASPCENINGHSVNQVVLAVTDKRAITCKKSPKQ